MSTKVFDAFRMKRKHWVNFLQRVHLYRKKRLPDAKTEFYDTVSLTCEKMDKVHSSEKWPKFLELHRKFREQKGWKADHQCDLVFHIHTDGYIYIKVFGSIFETRPFVSFLKRLRYVQEFEYMNCSDYVPPGVTPEDFEARAGIWEDVLSESVIGSFAHFEKIEIIPDFAEERYALPFWLMEYGVRPTEFKTPQGKQYYEEFELGKERQPW